MERSAAAEEAVSTEAEPYEADPAAETVEALRRMEIPSMLTFYERRIAELRTTSWKLQQVPMTHQMGVYLLASAEAHAQIHEWATRELVHPCPDKSKDRDGWHIWITCLRITRRQVACWANDAEYWQAWAPDAETEVWHVRGA